MYYCVIGCSNGKVQNISGAGIIEKALVIDFGNGAMCHISEASCKWEVGIIRINLSIAKYPNAIFFR